MCTAYDIPTTQPSSNHVPSISQTKKIDITFDRKEGPTGLQNGLDRICAEACQAAQMNYQMILLSDYAAGEER